MNEASAGQSTRPSFCFRRQAHLWLVVADPCLVVWRTAASWGDGSPEPLAARASASRASLRSLTRPLTPTLDARCWVGG